MIIKQVIKILENLAAPALQESYDNAGLLTGNIEWDCTGILISLDATEEIIHEAISQKCNLVVTHHPIIFGGIKKLTGKNYVEKVLITAIKNDVAIYAIHTNLDNIINGVNGRMADKLGLIKREVLQPKKGTLKKLLTFAPVAQAEKVRQALFDAGCGQIGNYSECSFNASGEGTFRAGANTNPFVGKIGERHMENEIKIESIFPSWLQSEVLAALKKSHPYEEVAYDIVSLDNDYNEIGAGLIGELAVPLNEIDFLELIKQAFNLKIIRHTKLQGKRVHKVAICGGAGSFLIGNAVSTGADFFITGDIKYHEFFDANDKLVLADIGHYESEQYTIDLLFDILKEKITTFAVLKTALTTNPVNYFI